MKSFGKTIVNQAPMSDREARLECLRLALELRSGVSTPATIIDNAAAFYRYADTGQKETQGQR